MEEQEAHTAHGPSQVSPQWTLYSATAQDAGNRLTLSRNGGSNIVSGPGPQWHALHHYYQAESRLRANVGTPRPRPPSTDMPSHIPPRPTTSFSPRLSPAASSLAGWNNYLMADELATSGRHDSSASIADANSSQGSHHGHGAIQMDGHPNYRGAMDHGARLLPTHQNQSRPRPQLQRPTTAMGRHPSSHYDHVDHLNSPMAQPSGPHHANLAPVMESLASATVERSRSSSVSSASPGPSFGPSFGAFQAATTVYNDHHDDWRLTVPVFNWLSAVLDPKRRPDKSTPAPSGNCLLCDTFCQRPGTLQQHVICQHRMRVARQYIQRRPHNDLLALAFTVLQLHSDRRPGPVETECAHFRHLLISSPPAGLQGFSSDAFPLLRETLHEFCHTDRWKGVTCEYCGLLAQRRATLEEHVTKCSYNPSAEKKKTSKKAGVEVSRRPRLGEALSDSIQVATANLTLSLLVDEDF